MFIAITVIVCMNTEDETNYCAYLDEFVTQCHAIQLKAKKIKGIIFDLRASRTRQKIAVEVVNNYKYLGTLIKNCQGSQTNVSFTGVEYKNYTHFYNK